MNSQEFEAKIDQVNKESKTNIGMARIFRNSKGYKLAAQMVANPDQKIHPDTSGRYGVTGYAHDAVRVLTLCGIKAWVSNDAPKGGKQGNFIVIGK